MPIEIRELVIKTEIVPAGRNAVPDRRNRELEKLRQELLAECRRLLAAAGRRKIHKR